MRKIILISLGAIAGVLVLFVIVVAMQPSEFVVTRSATFAAEAPQVFAQVNNLHNWNAWSPWAKLDPNAQNSFAGPAQGEGASFHWAGNQEVGEGTMTIVESHPHELIRIKLEFVKPFEDVADTEFTFRAQGPQTVVKWTMSGTNNFIAKAMCLFMDMDAMVGGQFEQGLENLRQQVESPASTASPGDAAETGSTPVPAAPQEPAP